MPDVHFCKIVKNILLTDAIYSITVKNRNLAFGSFPGQFLHIKCGEARLLRRPISICNVMEDHVNFVFEVKGEGTKWLSKRLPGDQLDILGPLGKGYEMVNGKFIVAGGGVGTPPLLYAVNYAANKTENRNATAILGFRSSDRIILKDEFESVCKKVYITTDDGSAGIHGAVTKPLEDLLKTGEYETVMSCGQILMQKAVAEVCKKYDVNCQVSLEERMGCGVGACLVCACAVKDKEGNEQMNRACADGPVFNSKNVIW